MCSSNCVEVCHPESHGVKTFWNFFSCYVLCATLDHNVRAALYASVVVYRSQFGVKLRAL